MPVGCGNKEVGLAFLNVQGMKRKLGELEDLLRGQKLGVLGLAETLLLPGKR